MKDIPFSQAIILRHEDLGERKVASCGEAMECLETEWPAWARGRSWRRALMICREALETKMDEKKARQRLMKAARRAGMMAIRRRDSAAYRTNSGKSAIASSALR